MSKSQAVATAPTATCRCDPLEAIDLGCPIHGSVTPRLPVSEPPHQQIRHALAALNVAEADITGGRRLSATEYRAVRVRLERAIVQLESAPR